MAIRGGLWDLAEDISRQNPELRSELEAARKNKKTPRNPGGGGHEPEAASCQIQAAIRGHATRTAAARQESEEGAHGVGAEGEMGG